MRWLAMMSAPTIVTPKQLKELTAKFSFQTIKEPLKFGWTRIFVGYSRLLIQGGDLYLMKFFRYECAQNDLP